MIIKHDSDVWINSRGRILIIQSQGYGRGGENNYWVNKDKLSFHSSYVLHSNAQHNKFILGIIRNGYRRKLDLVPHYIIESKKLEIMWELIS